jgi:hypothetical protein
MGYAEPEDWTTLNANDRVAKKESRSMGDCRNGLCRARRLDHS